MRKIICVLLCMLLLGAMVPAVYAAGSAHMSVSASASQVYRGDTVTFTVSISGVENGKAAGFVVDYDSNVFEWVSGSVLAGGIAMGDFSGGTGSLAYSEGTRMSGGIFSFKLRVKNTAPFGSSTVSGQGSARDTAGSIACSAGSAGVTVACNHSFANCTKVDANVHESTCSVCSEKKTENHSWDQEKVDKAATCKDTGNKTLTCSACAATKTETIPVSNEHKYGSWSKVNDSSHTHTCSVCAKTETVAHSWNSGKVLKEATCLQTGTKERSCTGCGTKKTETVPKADHAYSPWEKVDDNTHTHKCSVCDKVETLEHTYSENWEHDKQNHFQACEGCGYTKDIAAHVPGPEPTDTTDQICTVCQRILKPNLAHEHLFAAEWTSDAENHWHRCSYCDAPDETVPHVYTDVCDADCDVCGAVRQAPHVPAEEWSSDETGHWHLCYICKGQAAFAAHEPGAEATLTSPQCCNLCQFELSPVLPHDPVYGEGKTLHWHECACGERYEADTPEGCPYCEEEAKPFPWWIVCIAEAAAFGGVLVFLFLRYRNKQRWQNYV